jgi:inner membrane protein
VDIVTQGVLGGAVGYAVLGRRLGMKAIGLGVVGGIIPDLDVFLATGESVAFWSVHRGITHSFFFGPVLAIGLAAISQRWSSRGANKSALRLVDWYVFWTLVLITHPMLDLMTTYGTQIFAPFSRHPFAFSAISIIDPVYTGLLLAGFVLAWVWRSDRLRARRWMIGLLGVSTAYIGLSGYQNQLALREAKRQLTPAANVTVHAYTTIFSPWLRRVVVDSPSSLQVGYVSTVRPQPIRWVVLPRDPAAESLASVAQQTDPGKVFFRFAQGPRFARIASTGAVQELRISDARFGVPGPTVTGFWGLAIPLVDGQLATDRAYRYTVDRTPNAGDLQALFRAKLGLAQTVF